MSTKIPSIPNVPVGCPAELRPFLESLKEILETREVRRPNSRWEDGYALRSDFVGFGVLAKTGSGSAGNGYTWTGSTGGGDAYVSDPTPPPAPSGLGVTVGFSAFFVEWDAPAYTVGHGNQATIIYAANRGPGDPAPVFADAVEIGRTAYTSTMYVDEAPFGVTRHFWATHLTVDGTEGTPAGGINGVSGTIAESPDVFLAALTGALTESQLASSLATRIDLIDAPDTTPGSVAYQVRQEANARGAALIAEAAARGTAISNEALVREGADSALATQISLLTAGVEGGFDPGQMWHFDTTVDGWTGNATVDWGAGWISITGIATPELTSPTFSLTGVQYTVVKARIRRLAGSAWIGRCYYSTAGHGFTAGYYKEIPEPAIFDVGDIDVVEFDMTDLDAGGTDWVDSTITGIRLVLGSVSGDEIEVDWVGIGRNAPGASSAALATEQAARIAGDSAEATARQALAVKTTGLADPSGATLATLTAGLIWEERQARSTATGAAVTRLDALEATVNHPSTGVTATATALDTVELIVNHATTGNSALGTRTSTLESTISHGTTGLAAAHAAVASEAGTRAGADNALGNLITTITARLNSGGDVYSAIVSAQSTASAKNANFVQDATPTATKVDDTWIRPADGNLLRRWNGSAWVVADDQRIGSTATQVTTLQASVKGGGNLLPNAGFESNVSGWEVGYNPGGYSYAAERDLAGSTWVPNSGHTVGMTIIGAITTTADLHTNPMTVQCIPGARYIASAWLAAHRCNCSLILEFLGAGGAFISLHETAQVGWTTASAPGGQNLANWIRRHVLVTAPANARSMNIILRMHPVLGELNPHAWLTMPFIGEADANQTQPTPWEPSSAGLNSGVASLQQSFTTQASQIGGLHTQYTLKSDLNGYLSGFGFASTANNSAPVSEFLFRADKFKIASPSGPGITPIVPFSVFTTSQVEAGQTFAPGVYMDAAYMRNLSAMIAKFGAASIDEAKIGTLSVSKINAGSMSSTFATAVAAQFGTLSAINTNTGTLTIDSTGAIRGGATGYLTGTGFWVGYHSGLYKMFVGDPTGKNWGFNGVEPFVNGEIINTGNLVANAATEVSVLSDGQVHLSGTSVFGGFVTFPGGVTELSVSIAPGATLIATFTGNARVGIGPDPALREVFGYIWMKAWIGTVGGTEAFHSHGAIGGMNFVSRDTFYSGSPCLRGVYKNTTGAAVVVILKINFYNLASASVSRFLDCTGGVLTAEIIKK